MNKENGTYPGRRNLRSLSDNEIVAGILETGDYSLYSEIVERNKGRLFRLCLGFFVYEEDAEDMLQDIFLKAFERLGSFRRASSFSTWLYRIAINMCLNEKRRGKRSIIMDGSEDTAWLRGGGSDTPEEKMITKEVFVRINNAVAQLPDRQKTAYLLSRFNDLSIEEIAAIMDISRAAADSLLQRARRSVGETVKDVLK